MYDVETGRSLSSRRVRYIVPATQDHTFALQKRIERALILAQCETGY